MLWTADGKGNIDGERERERERDSDRGERDKTQIERSIREIMLSPDCVTACVHDIQHYAANLANLKD